MAFGARVTTTTQDKIMPMVIDTILNSNVAATRYLLRAKKWAGESMKFPLKVSKNTTGTSFAGLDTFATSATDNRVNLAFDAKFQQITAALPLTELSVNNVSETQVINLAAITLKTAADDMADDIGTAFWADGTGNSSKDFNGFGAIIDDGTDVGTYGGLSRTTYTTLNATRTASGGTLSLAKMSTLYNGVTSGSQKPTVGYSTEAVFNLYEALVQPQERIAKDVPMMKAAGMISKAGEGFVGGTGFTGMFFKGFPILADEKCTSQVLAFVDEEYVDFYALPVAMTSEIKFKSSDVEGNDYSDVMGLGFTWSGWIKPDNAAAVVGHVYLGGELIGSNPKRTGKLTGLTSV